MLTLKRIRLLQTVPWRTYAQLQGGEEYTIPSDAADQLIAEGKAVEVAEDGQAMETAAQAPRENAARRKKPPVSSRKPRA